MTAQGQTNASLLGNATVAIVSHAFVHCSALPSASVSNATLETLMTSQLLDSNLTTCLNPYDGSDQLQISLDVRGLAGHYVWARMTGKGLHCKEPSTLVYSDVTDQLCESPDNSPPMQCAHVETGVVADQTTCHYSCTSGVACGDSVRTTFRHQRIGWLPESQTLEELCDIQINILN